MDRVLLVDDDPVSLTAYKIILGEHFAVDAAETPQQALAVLARGGHAVVVADMVMPELDGIAFLQRVAEVAPATVGIILTAHARLETAMAAVNQGHVFGFFSKSSDPAELIAGIRKALARHRSARRRPRQLSSAEVLSPEEIDFLTRN